MKVQLSHKLSILFEHHRYKILYGGRGGGKSYGIAIALLILGAQKKHRILCTREFQASIKDSVHKLLSNCIATLGLSHFYRVTDTKIFGINGTEFIFAGLHHNADSIKSTEGITIAWVEEAQCISEASWKILTPTVRVPGSEIWASFNPDDEDDVIYKQFVANEYSGAAVVKINWEDNPWISEELLKEKDEDYKRDPEAADHIWGGNTRKNSVAAVLRGRYEIDEFAPLSTWNGPYFGCDWGFGADPTAAVKCWIDGRVLYIEREVYGHGVDIDDTPALFKSSIPGMEKHVVRADKSRPETISYMRRNGYPMMIAAKCGPNSIDDGVEHLRSYEKIVIHPRCKHAIEEAKLWSYKIDPRSGDVLPILKEGWDHLMDATRYSLEPIIRAGKPKPKVPEKKSGPHDYDYEKRSEGSWKTA